MPPPTAFLKRKALAMKPFLPTITDPIGHPNPLLRQTETESQCFTNSEAGTLSATAVLKSLAPSQCNGKLNSLQVLANSSIQSRGTARPPQLLLIDSTIQGN